MVRTDTGQRAVRPLVAIVGRANVGKSTLFNRILGRKKAITADLAGVTRDLNYADVEEGGRAFTIIDTGGFEAAPEGIMNDVRMQARLAIEEADVIVLLMDGTAGLTHGDREIADLLRRSGKPVIYAVNKIDSPSREALLSDFYSLGAAPLIGLSAEHGLNISELMDALGSALRAAPALPVPAGQAGRVAVAILGRPNVGKSSLLNMLIGRERTLVSDIAGTTRDPIDTPVTVKGRDYLFIDTAGIRRKTRISLTVESCCVIEAIRSMERSQAVLLVIDGSDGLKSQDERIAGLIEERKKPCIIVVNKWDIVEKDSRTTLLVEERIREGLPFLSYAPVVFVSALTGKRVDRILPVVDEVVEEGARKVPTSRLNAVLQRAVTTKRPPLYRGRPVKLFYGAQFGVSPPSFVIFVNRPDGISATYVRYLRRSLRAGLGLERSPMRLVFRRRH